MNASEQQATEAIRQLKRMIEAAENSNQDGENAVVAAADGPTMRRAILDMAGTAPLDLLRPHELQQMLRAIAGERHTHVASIGSDRCDWCRRDLRDAVHLRLAETAPPHTCPRCGINNRHREPLAEACRDPDCPETDAALAEHINESGGL